MKNQDKLEPEKRQPQQERPSTEGNARKNAIPESKAATGAKPAKCTLTHTNAVKRFNALWFKRQFVLGVYSMMDELDPAKRSALLYELAEQFCLDVDENAPLAQLAAIHYPETSDPDFGFCHVVHETNNFPENPCASPDPLTLDPVQKHQLKLYPVHISISPMATQEEVIDYVSKRWTEIRRLLDTHHKKPPRLRMRPQQERDFYVWEHQRVHYTKLAEDVNRKFPSTRKLTYSDIQGIIQKLRARGWWDRRSFE
jgi:hypothetical protein